MGFSDRINETLRGAKAALYIAELRQKLVEAEVAQDNALRRLGGAVHSAYFANGAESIDPQFVDACREVDETGETVTDLRRQIDAASQTAPEQEGDSPARFCSACGARSTTDGPFCPSCGGQIGR